MMTMKQVLTGTALTLLSLTAAAESGAYLGVAAGQSTAIESFDGYSIQGSDSAYKLFAGYRFNDNFSLEADYIDAGAPSATFADGTVWLDSAAFEFSAIGNIPVTDHLGIFLRGSVVSWESNLTYVSYAYYDNYFEYNSGTDIGWGVGMTAQMSKHFSIRGEYEGADLGGTDSRLLSLSAVFHF